MQLSREASDFYSEDCGLEPRMGVCAPAHVLRVFRAGTQLTFGSGLLQK